MKYGYSHQLKVVSLLLCLGPLNRESYNFGAILVTGDIKASAIYDIYTWLSDSCDCFLKRN